MMKRHTSNDRNQGWDGTGSNFQTPGPVNGRRNDNPWSHSSTFSPLFVDSLHTQTPSPHILVPHFSFSPRWIWTKNILSFLPVPQVTLTLREQLEAYLAGTGHDLSSVTLYTDDPHAVSEEEALGYFVGLLSHPILVYRTGDRWLLEVPMVIFV